MSFIIVNKETGATYHYSELYSYGINRITGNIVVFEGNDFVERFKAEEFELKETS